MRSLPLAMVRFLNAEVSRLKSELLRRQENQVVMAERQQAADSWLNHTLKNLMGAAAAALLLLIDKEKTLPVHIVSKLNYAIGQLNHGMTWCHKRQMFLQIVLGTYHSRLSPINLSELASKMQERYQVTVRQSFPSNLIVLFDEDIAPYSMVFLTQESMERKESNLGLRFASPIRKCRTQR